MGLNIAWELFTINNDIDGELFNAVNELVEALYECRNDEGSERYKFDFQYRKFVQQAMSIQKAFYHWRPEDDETDKEGKVMTEEQVKTYSTKCEIEYSQEYLERRDMTIIFEDTYLVSGPDKVMVRERICGLYHGEPNDDSFKRYYTSGVEAVMDDELMAALSKNEVEHAEPKSKLEIAVVKCFFCEETKD